MNNKIKFGTDGWRAIIAEDFTVENNGDWKYDWTGPREYCVAYWVKNKTKRFGS
jgi:hypothetical protein